MVRVQIEIVNLCIGGKRPEGVLPYEEVGGAWPQILPLKFMSEPQILSPKI